MTIALSLFIKLILSNSNVFGDREIRLNSKIGKSFFNSTCKIVLLVIYFCYNVAIFRPKNITTVCDDWKNGFYKIKIKSFFFLFLNSKIDSLESSFRSLMIFFSSFELVMSNWCSHIFLLPNILFFIWFASEDNVVWLLLVCGLCSLNLVVIDHFV
jgi:hypothetical protein